MKRSLFQQSVLQFAVAGALFPHVSAADWLTFEGEEKPWAVNIGTRVWVHEWESNVFSRDTTVTAANTTIATSRNQNFQNTSEEFEPTPIPYANVRYGRFHVSGSYYAETDFDFQTRVQTSEVQSAGEPALLTTDFQQNSEGERSEWDIAVGYYILKYLALNVGYKNIEMDFRGSSRTDRAGSAIPSTFVLGTGKADNRFYGPTLGASGSAPIANGFGIYGSYAHGFLEWDFDSNNTSEVFLPDGTPVPGSTNTGGTKIKNVDVDYDIAELGITYTPTLAFLGSESPLSAATVFAGYRFQRLSYDVPGSVNRGVSTNDSSDTTHGFVAGLNFAF